MLQHLRDERIKQLKTEKTLLRVERDELRRCLRQLVKDIDDWEAAVEKIIGRPPNATWGNLEDARKLLAGNPRKEEGR